MPRKVRSTLQIMISFIFILLSTRTEPYRNFILATKKKKKRNKNHPKTKNLENRFWFDCSTGSSSGPLLVPRSAILLASAKDPSVVLDKRIGPGLYTDSPLPLEKIGERHRFFPIGGGRQYTARSEPPFFCVPYVQYLQSFFNILINIFKFQFFYLISISNCVPKIVFLLLC